MVGKSLKVLIVGGGIGGLGAAIALRRRGFEIVCVLEKASDWTHVQIGSGLDLHSNAVQALDELGVADRMIECGVPVNTVRMVSPRGALLGELPHAEVARKYAYPGVRVERGELHRALLDAAGGTVTQLGKRVTGFAQSDSGVSVTFDDGTEERGDILVAADGLRSTIREELHADGEPTYRGYPWWRGTHSGPHPAVQPGTTQIIIGTGGAFAAIPVGDEKVSWFAAAKAPMGQGVMKAQMLDRFGHWSTTIRELIEGTDESTLTSTDLVDRDPLTWWGHGRVTLLGDAAHPMVPTLSQGAAQALEDAVVLARCMNLGGDPVAALRAYEAIRIPRTTEVVLRARSTGNVMVMDNPVVCWFREKALVLGWYRVFRRQFLQQMSVRV